ncbi:MAG: hypothetical protein LBC85_01000 [Fibromonadaceae bacterium]|jgi:hypothetical protein|nr:hypothetical protein [Fibromonadaceae bacterium]
MRILVKFSVAAVVAVFLTSCYSDLPELPVPQSVQVCKYTNALGQPRCETTYVISEKECGIIGGTLVAWTNSTNLENCEISE